MESWWRVSKIGGIKFCVIGRAVVRFHFHHFLGLIRYRLQETTPSKFTTQSRDDEIGDGSKKKKKKKKTL